MSRTTLDTSYLRIREVFAINPQNKDFIKPLQIPSIGANGQLVWYSSLQLLSSISIPTTSCSVLDILTTVQSGISTLSTIQSSTLNYAFPSTVEGLVYSGYATQGYVQNQTSLLSQDKKYISATTLYDVITHLADMRWITDNAGPMGLIGGPHNQYGSNLSGGYISSFSLFSTVAGLGSSGYVSSLGGEVEEAFVSTTIGLGSSGYVSTASLTSTVYGIENVYIGALGNTLRVDAVNGNDYLASAASPYSVLPFKTIRAALARALPGQTVWVLPGVYEEPIEGTFVTPILIPDGVSIRGVSSESCIISQGSVEGITVDATMVIMGIDTRLEDITISIKAKSSGIQLIGVDFPSDTAQTSKLRCVDINILQEGATVNNEIFGIRSAGTSSTEYSNQTAVRETSITINGPLMQANNTVRGILVEGSNRISVRDSTILITCGAASGIGIETNHANAIIDVATTTINASTSDIKQTAGNIILTYTNLFNSTSGGNSFTVASQAAYTNFCIIGNLGTNQTYNLAPGNLPIGGMPATAIQTPLTQASILYTGSITFSTPVPTGVTLTLNIYKNGGPSPVFTVALAAGQTKNSNITTSADFLVTDLYNATLTTVGNPGVGTFSAIIAFY
jgi:hypothetical protein